MFPTDDTPLDVIRRHLAEQSTPYLVDLLVDLIQAVDEPTRQRFWPRLAPPAMATADLLYESPEEFLTELQEFAAAVQAGDYFSEEALEYFGEDPVDRQYRQDKYDWLEDFDPDEHEGLIRLGDFLSEADSCFEVGEYDVAATAYEIILGIIDSAPEETLGIYDPLSELGESEEQLGQRYFVALKESCPTAAFYEKAIQYLAHHDRPYRQHMNNFMNLVGAGARQAVQAFLEQWADNLAQRQSEPLLVNPPYQLQLLLRNYDEANQPEKILSLQQRFRRVYLPLYEPLVTERVAAADWQTVVAYGQELLALLPPNPPNQPYYLQSRGLDISKIRAQMAQAYENLGDLENALAVYRPVYEQRQDFQSYALVKRLTTAINPQEGQALTAALIAQLQSKQPRSLYLLCQVYLNENRFADAYNLVREQRGYNNLDTVKLVAKAHLLAALGAAAAPGMGPYLQDLYAKLNQADNEPIQFLRAGLPSAPAADRPTLIAHAEDLYRNLMQVQIDNGRKTYAVAAYYCALLGEIAAFDGRAAQFKQFYQQLLNNYPRHRALRQELAEKVKLA